MPSSGVRVHSCLIAKPIHVANRWSITQQSKVANSWLLPENTWKINGSITTKHGQELIDHYKHVVYKKLIAHTGDTWQRRNIDTYKYRSPIGHTRGKTADRQLQTRGIQKADRPYRTHVANSYIDPYKYESWSPTDQTHVANSWLHPRTHPSGQRHIIHLYNSEKLCKVSQGGGGGRGPM